MKSDPDIQNMLKFKEGNIGAFRILFNKYKKKIINFNFRFCTNKEVAEELAQEVFLRVYKAAPKYRPDAKFSTWIFRIATNVCLNEIRKKQYRHKTESIDCPVPSKAGDIQREIEDPEKLPQEMLETSERDTLIQKAISELPEKQRAAILLRVFHGFSYQEIEKQMKCSQNSVKTLIHRARQHLKKKLSFHLRGE